MTLELSSIGLISASLLGFVAAVHLSLAFGMRYGYMVWSGRHVSRLPSTLRVLSFVYAIGLLLSAVVLLDITGYLDTALVADTWGVSAGLVVSVFLGIATLASLLAGTRWDRMIFVPITLLGAGVAGWIAFA